MVEHKLVFSETGLDDLKSISTSAIKAFQYAIEARQNGGYRFRAKGQPV